MREILDRSRGIETSQSHHCNAVDSRSFGMGGDLAANRSTQCAEDRGMPEKIVRFAEFEVDCTRFRLFRNGEAVRLEGTPLQLLIFLVEHPCELISREQIAEARWDNGVFIDVETSINTAVRKVRIALDDDSAQPKYLQTVVGRGIGLSQILKRRSFLNRSIPSARRRVRPGCHSSCGYRATKTQEGLIQNCESERV